MIWVSSTPSLSLLSLSVRVAAGAGGGGSSPDGRIPSYSNIMRIRYRNKIESDLLIWLRTPFSTVPSSMPQLAKSTHAAASLSRYEFVVSISLNVFH